MSVLNWFLFIVAILLFYWAVATQNKFSILTKDDGTPRFVMLSGLINTDGTKGAIATWWKNIDKDSSPGQQFVVLVVVLLVAYVEFGWSTVTKTEDGITTVVQYGHVWFALFLLFVASIISPPKGWFTKAFVAFDLVVLVAASFIPGVGDIRSTSIEIARLKAEHGAQYMKKYAENLKACNEGKPECIKGDIETPTTQSTQASQSTFKTTPQTLHLVPGGIFQSVGTPPGARIIENVEWGCPQGCIREIEHDSDMLCKNWDGHIETDEAGHIWHIGTYNGNTICSVTNISATRYRERFAAPPGSTNYTLVFPNNLIGVISSFGTIPEIGPIDVTVTVITS